MRPWENVTLRLGYHNVPVYTTDVGDGITPKGYVGGLFTNITAAMGLRWKRVPLSDPVWGMCNPNGTCVGQLGAIQSGESDLALGPIVYTEEVSRVMNLWRPTIYENLVFVHGFESPYLPAGSLTLIKIYPLTIWILLLFCCAILPAIAWMINVHSYERQPIVLGDHFSTFMEQLLQEAPPIRYKSSNLRIFFCGWMLAALVLSSFASAVLKSVMTIRTPAPRIETVNDVLKMNPTKLRVRAPAGSGILEVLQGAAMKSLNELGDFIVKSNGLTRPSEMFQNPIILREIEVGRATFIFPCHYLTSFFYSPVSRVKDARGYVYCSKGRVVDFVCGWVTPKNASPLMQLIYEEMDKRILWMSESPVYHLYHHELYPPELDERVLYDRRSKQMKLASLSLENVSGAFWVYGIVSWLSIVGFVFEQFVHKFGKIRPRKIRPTNVAKAT